MSTSNFDSNKLNIKIYPNSAQDFIAIQSQMNAENLKAELIEEMEKVVKTSQILL